MDRFGLPVIAPAAHAAGPVQGAAGRATQQAPHPGGLIRQLSGAQPALLRKRRLAGDLRQEPQHGRVARVADLLQAPRGIHQVQEGTILHLLQETLPGAGVVVKVELHQLKHHTLAIQHGGRQFVLRSAHHPVVRRGILALLHDAVQHIAGPSFLSEKPRDLRLPLKEPDIPPIQRINQREGPERIQPLLPNPLIRAGDAGLLVDEVAGAADQQVIGLLWSQRALVQSPHVGVYQPFNPGVEFSLRPRSEARDAVLGEHTGEKRPVGFVREALVLVAQQQVGPQPFVQRLPPLTRQKAPSGGLLHRVAQRLQRVRLRKGLHLALV